MTKDIAVKNNELGELVTRYRRAKDISGRQAAKLAGIDSHTMSMLERGGYAAPRPKTLRRIARTLDIPILDVFYAAGYLAPEDLVDMVRDFNPDLARSKFEPMQIDEAKNRYIETQIEKFGLDYVGPEYKPPTDGQ